MMMGILMRTNNSSLPRAETSSSVCRLEAALNYASLGYPVIPIRPGAKSPLTPHGLKDATTDEVTIRTWWNQWPEANVAIRCDKLAVIDVDKGANWPSDDLLRAMAERGPSIQRTPRKGWHFLYRLPDGKDWRSTTSRIASHVDTRCGPAGYIVVSPSATENGIYSWEPNFEIRSPELLPAPPDELAKILDGLSKPNSNGTIPYGNTEADHPQANDADLIPEGQRNVTLTSIAGRMRRGGLPEHAILGALLEINAKQCQPPLSEDEVRKIAASISRYPTPRPIGVDGPEDIISELRGLRLTDTGLAERFADQHREKVLYCPKWNEWLVWDEVRWRRNDLSQIDKLAKETVFSLYREVDSVESRDERRMLTTFANKAEAASRREAMLRLAQAEVANILPDDLDKDPYLLGIPDGVVDLRTGEIKPADRSLLISKITSVSPRGEPPQLWLEALHKIFSGNEELIRFLQQLFGYCLTGLTTHHYLPIFYGCGRNGKSLILETALGVLGDYATRVSSELLVADKGDKHPTMVASLQGVRLAICQETARGASLDEALVKTLTGGDMVTARKMRQDYYQFKPTHKIILSTNHKPRVRGTDRAIWARLLLVPFNVTFWDPDKGERGPDELKADKQLPEKLRKEYPEILHWMIQGAVSLFQDDFHIPEIVLDSTEDYKQREDILSDWIEDQCAIEPNAKTPTKDLWESYEQWCSDNGEDPISKKAFSNALSERGFPSTKGSKGKKCRAGISLKSRTQILLDRQSRN
jgi:putative DNA primase/helicase